MIEVSPEAACMLYLGIAILAVLGIWLFQHKKSQKKEIISYTTAHFTCEFCHSAYLDDPLKTVTRCPECQSLNKNLK